jgi:hypothetical protein
MFHAGYVTLLGSGGVDVFIGKKILLPLPRIEPQIDWLYLLGCSRTT